MKKTLLLTIIVFASIILTHAQTFTYNDNWADAGYNLTALSPQNIQLTYSVAEFTLDDIEIRGEAMKQVRLSQHFLPGDEGAPDLPGSGRYIALPQGAKPILHIKSLRKEVYKNVNIAPAPRIPKDTERGPLEYNKNNRIYALDALYPAQPVKLSEVTTIRGVDAVILGITPFQYNPVTKELIVLRDIEVEIEFQGGNGHFGEDRYRSQWWEPILSDLFVNYEQLPDFELISRQSTVGGQRELTGFEYLIICPDLPEFIQWADSIKMFRTMQGIYTGVVTITEVGGNTVNAIETYVNNAYNTWDIPPAAILLLGDYGNGGGTITSPIWDSYCVSDHLYADVNGDDEEEIVFARMTARDAGELEVMIRKAIDYETDPPTDPDFYNHPITALGWQTERWFQICSEVVGGYFKNVQGKDPVRINAVYDGNPDVDPWSTATNTATVLSEFGPSGLGYIPASPTELGGWTGGTATQVNSAINAGSFLLQHRDHGYEYGWGEPDYSSDNIPGLTNTDLSFIFSINCLTGKYNYSSECFAEKFHRYTYNGEPAGALGLLAASEVSYSFVNDAYVWGVFDNLWPDFMPDFGTTPESRGLLPAFGNAAGKYFLKYSSWPYNTDNKEVTYNLFHHHGDAFTCLYSEVPQDLTIVHDPVHLAGLSTFTISANEGSLIALSVEGELIGVATGTGIPQNIPIIAQNPPVFIDVVVTKQNYYRYHVRVQVIPPSGPFVIPESYVVADAAGNNNGKLDYNENVLLDMTLKNLGSDVAENVMVSITSDDEYVTIVDGTAEAGTIASNETSFVAGAFSITAAGNVPNGHYILLNMEATDGDTVWTSSFSIKAHAPLLEYVDFIVDDASGNNNGKLDPGETAQLTVSVKNKGAAAAYNVYGLLQCNDPFIEVLADSANFGDLAENQTVAQSYQVSASVITPPGHQADFALLFTGNSGLTTTGEFSIFVGLFPILILDLDPNNNSADLMQETIEEWRIFAEYNDAIPADLSQYKTIFICLGTYSDNYVMTENDATPFIEFLDNGGNLYMEGADTWYYDQLYNPTSLHPMFNISGIEDGSGDLSTLNGVSGTFTEGMTYYFNGENNYIDQVSAIAPAYTIFSNSTPAYDAAVAFNEGTYRTIGSTFEFGGLVDSPNFTKKDLMRKYLEFFSMAPISQIPEQPVGDTIVCSDMSSCVYSTQPVEGAEYYIWELNPPEAGTVEGWDTAVTINWTPEYLGPSTLRVCGMNQNGLGPVSLSLYIEHQPLPAAEITFSSTNICAGDTTYASIDLTGTSPWLLIVNVGGIETPLYSEKVNMDDIPLFPTGDIEVTLVSVTDATGCVATGYSPTLITVMLPPSNPALPSGPENIDLFSGSQSVYSTAGSANADSYEWIIEPAEAGTLTPNETGTEITVDWASSFVGLATLKSKGINGCGESGLSDPLSVNVYNTFGVQENTSGLDIKVYPNPNSGDFRIDLSANQLTRAKISLFNAAGKPVWGPENVDINHKTSIPVHTGTLPKGVYLLKIETGQGLCLVKVVLK